MDLKYGLICEDFAQKYFLEKFLEKSNFSFNLDENFYYRFRANNKKQVLKTIKQIGYNAFAQHRLDVLFIGLDYDDKDQKSFQEETRKIYSTVAKNIKNTTIVFYPIQAIEHWLLYLKFRIENPKSTKNIKFENISRRKAKLDIYNSIKVSENKTVKIINELTEINFINWLNSKSDSFKKFNLDFKIVIQELQKQ